MQISSAASAVLNAAASGAVAGLGVKAAAEDAASPFGGLLADALHPLSAVAGDPFSVPSVHTAPPSLKGGRTAPGLIAQPPISPTSVAATVVAQSGAAAKTAIFAAADDRQASPQAQDPTQLPLNQAKSLNTIPATAAQAKPKAAKATAVPDGGVKNSDVGGAPYLSAASLQPLTITALPEADPLTVSADTSAEATPPPSPQLQAAPAAEASPQLSAPDKMPVMAAPPQSQAEPLAQAAQSSAPELTPASPAPAQSSTQASATDQQSSPPMQAIPTTGTASTAPPPASTVVQAPTPPPSSAVAQFTGRARGGASAGGVTKSASGADRSQTAATSTSLTGAKAVAASSDAKGFDVAEATAADAQSGDQNASASEPGAPLTPAASDAAQQAVLGPMAQVSPPADAAPARTVQDTVANLAAQITQKAGGQTTRFDVQLDPFGLGRVNVSVEIDAKGAMTAALSFEKPEAANLLKSHAAELQQSLAQAGFNLADSALSFSTAAQHGGGSPSQTALLGGGFDGSGGQSSRGGQAQTASRGFGAASLAADQADQINTAVRTLSARGLDIRI